MVAIATGMHDGGREREGRATAHLVAPLRPNIEPPLTLSRSPLLPPAQPLPRHLGALAGFTAVKPSNDHLIRDAMAQTDCATRRARGGTARTAHESHSRPLPISSSSCTLTWVWWAVSRR